MRRLFWTAVVFLGALTIVLAIWKGIPLLLYSIGLGREFGVSMLRVGYITLDRDIVFSDGERMSRTFSGPAVGLEGERLVVNYRVEPDEGDATIAVRRSFVVSDSVWSREFESRASGQQLVRLPATGLYQIYILYRGYTGEVEFSWKFLDASE